MQTRPWRSTFSLQLTRSLTGSISSFERFLNQAKPSLALFLIFNFSLYEKQSFWTGCDVTPESKITSWVKLSAVKLTSEKEILHVVAQTMTHADASQFERVFPNIRTILYTYLCIHNGKIKR